MKYNFDELVERRGTDSVKVDGVKFFFGRDDLMPLWVADMDFRTPPFVLEAVEQRNRKGVLGYTFAPREWKKSVVSWLNLRFGWEVEKPWIQNVPGVVPGMALALLCYTKPGDAVLIQPPVYHPFFEIVEHNGRLLRQNPLVFDGENYIVDFEDFERKVKECKVFLLCNPHNPGGRVWSKAELEKMAEICARNHVLVFSDEIHADMYHKPYRHTPFASVSSLAAENSVTFMSATKSFNMPALALAYTVIPNEKVRGQLLIFLDGLHLSFGNSYAFEALMAAYTEVGRDWLEQMLSYVYATMDFMQHYFETEIPLIRMVRPQTSFLVWLDCRALELSQSDLRSLFEEDAHLALNDGTMFGKEGSGFMRMNVAAPRVRIEEALLRLKGAVNKRFPKGVR